MKKVETPRATEMKTNMCLCRYMKSMLLFVFALIVVLSQYNFAQAQDFSDSDWRECAQKNIDGRWDARSHSQTAPKTIWFHEREITFLFPTGEKNTYAFKRALGLKAGSTIELIVEKANAAGQLPRVLKIRPHTVIPIESSQGAVQESNCLVKVFRFASLKHAKAGKYSDWNIYQKEGK